MLCSCAINSVMNLCTPWFFLFSYKARVALGKFWSIIRQKRINVYYHSEFPYATGVSQISKISESPQKLQRHWSVWVGQADFEKIKKTNDTASGTVNASHLTQIWPAVKLFNRREFLIFTRQRLAWMIVFLFIMRRDSQAKMFVIWTIHWLDRA